MQRLIPRINKRVVIVLNYHRIGSVDPRNPFHRLHTVSSAEFARQLDLAEVLGSFVELSDLDAPVDLPPLGFCVTLDDAPVDALAGIEELHAREIPYAVSVCTDLADVGAGMRDRVYTVLSELDDDEIYRFLLPRLGGLMPPPDRFSFYAFSKSAALPAAVMEEQVVEPLHAIACERRNGAHLGRGYLDWAAIRDLICDPLATLVNHGKSHANLAALTAEEVRNDVSASHQRFIEETSITPTYFAVPFGAVDQRVCLDINPAAQAHGYRGVLWVGKASNVVIPPPIRRYVTSCVCMRRRARRVSRSSCVRCSSHSGSADCWSRACSASITASPSSCAAGQTWAKSHRLSCSRVKTRLTPPTRGSSRINTSTTPAGANARHSMRYLPGAPGDCAVQLARDFQWQASSWPSTYPAGVGYPPRTAWREGCSCAQRRTASRHRVQAPASGVVTAFADWIAVDVWKVRIEPATVRAAGLHDVNVAQSFPRARCAVRGRTARRDVHR